MIPAYKGARVITEEEKWIAEGLLVYLEHIKVLPQMYVGTDDPRAVDGIITGMMLALQLCKHSNLIPRHDLIRDTVREQRGWDISKGQIEQMQAAGMDNSAIVHEIVSIEIETIRQRTQIQA